MKRRKKIPWLLLCSLCRSVWTEINCICRICCYDVCFDGKVWKRVFWLEGILVFLLWWTTNVLELSLNRNWVNNHLTFLLLLIYNFFAWISLCGASVFKGNVVVDYFTHISLSYSHVVWILRKWSHDEELICYSGDMIRRILLHTEERVFCSLCGRCKKLGFKGWQLCMFSEVN